MSFVINPLSKSNLELHVDDFIKMSNRNIENENWSSVNFLVDLPRKWELSFYVSNDSGVTAAFLIASEKAHSIHIHKFVVDKPYQQIGLGSKMLEFLKKGITKPLTLKVNVNNFKAIDFYTRKGFATISTEQDMYVMKTV